MPERKRSCRRLGRFYDGRMRIPLLATTALGLTLALAGSAQASSFLVSVPKALKVPIAKIAQKPTSPAVLVPTRVRAYLATVCDPAKNLRASGLPKCVFGSGGATKKGYDLELGYGRCGGANACFVAAFLADRGGTPSAKKKTGLLKGLTGYWRDISCGASCSPAEIEWVEDGVLYTIQYKGVLRNGVKKTLVGLADSAIGAGPRR